MGNFIWPYLILILPAPILVWWLLPALRGTENSARPDALRVPFFKELFGLGRVVHTQKTVKSLVLLGFSWFFLVLAAMRPYRYQSDIPFPQEARNIMLAIDVSNSMNRRDFKINNRPISRLDIVKFVVRNFILNRKGDKLGLVIFATQAFPLAPLTQDMQALDEIFSDLDSDVREITGEKTAIGDALALSVQNTASIPAGKKVVILLSDGASNSGKIKVDQAIELAQKQEIAVYTIGLDPMKSTSFLNLFSDERLGLNEKKLKKIADMTGGKYFSVATTDDLISVYRAIDKLETETIDSRYTRPRQEMFYIPLLIGLMFFYFSQLGWHKK